MKHRKHRIAVDVTFSKGITYRDAHKGLQMALDDSHIKSKRIWYYNRAPFIRKMEVIEISMSRKP